MRAWALVGMLSVALAAQVSGRRPDCLTLPSRGLSGPLRAEIHLPAGYAADPDRRYPVCLLLHGGGGSARELRELGLADLATRHGVIIVAPDAGEALFEDAEAGDGPRLASALVETLLPAVDRRYRTLGSRQGRLLVGLSLGGYSALHLGITHPEAFGFIASLRAWWASPDGPPRTRAFSRRACAPSSTRPWGNRAPPAARPGISPPSWIPCLPPRSADCLSCAWIAAERIGSSRPIAASPGAWPHGAFPTPSRPRPAAMTRPSGVGSSKRCFGIG